MNIKRLTALILIAVTINILTGCNSKKEIFSKAQLTNIYRTKYLEVPEGYTADTPCYINDKIYIKFTKYTKIENVNNGSASIETDNVLYIYDLNGTVSEIMDLNSEVLKDVGNCFMPSNDDIFYTMNTKTIQKVTYTGTIIWKLDFEEAFNIKTVSTNIPMQLLFDENYLYILSYEGSIGKILPIVFVLTLTGEPVHKFYVEEDIKKILKAPDGEILLQCYNTNIRLGNSRYNYYAINIKNLNLEEYKIPKLPDTFTSIIQISEGEIYYDSSFATDYGMYYKDNYGLYGYDPKSMKSELLVNWANSDLLNEYCTVLSVITPDVVLCRLSDIYTQQLKNSELVLLIRIPDDEIVAKTIITIANTETYNFRSLRPIIVMFNRQSDDYRIVIDDYSTYNTDDDPKRSNTLFNLDTAAGVVHDIVLCSTPDIYAKKGMFVDLYDFINADVLLGILRNKYETKGKLYALPYSFSIYTLTGKPSLVGAKESLTLDELIEINNDLPPETRLFTSFDNYYVFYYTLQSGANDYIDYDRGICSFDDGDFIKMLKFVKTLPEDSIDNFFAPINTIRNNEGYLYEFYVNSLKSFIELKYWYGEDEYVIKGFPNQSGNGTIVNCYSFLSINSKSPRKQGAREFIKFFLSDEMQAYPEANFIPVTNTGISKTFEKLMEKHYYAVSIMDDGSPSPYLTAYDFELNNATEALFTEKDAERIKQFFNTTKATPKADETVISIILEEINPFFAGKVTAEQCAKYIQNRVSTYLNEQK